MLWTEGEDVSLPHLVGSCPLEKPRPRDVVLCLLPCRTHQLVGMQYAPHCLKRGLKKKYTAQHLEYTPYPKSSKCSRSGNLYKNIVSPFVIDISATHSHAVSIENRQVQGMEHRMFYRGLPYLQ